MNEVGKKVFDVVRWIFLVFFFVGIVGFILSQIFLPSERDMSDYVCEEFSPQWVQVMDDGTRKPVDIPGTLEGEKGEWFTIETKVTPKLATYGYLCLQSSRQEMKVFVDSKLRTSYSMSDTRLYGEDSVSAYVFAKFSPDDDGKTLTVEFRTNTLYSGMMKTMYYGSQAGIWFMIARVDGLEFFIGIILLILSIVCVIVSLAMRFFSKLRYAQGDILYISFSVMLTSIWIIAQSHFRQVIFPNLTSISDFAYFALMLMPLPISIFMDQLQEYRYHIGYLAICAIAILNTIVCSVLQLTSLVDYGDSVTAMFVVLILMIILLGVTVAIDIKRKQIDSYLHVAIGFAGVSVMGIVQMLIYLFKINGIGSIPLCLGFMFLLVMTVVRLLRNAVNTENEKLEAIRASKMQEEFLANMSHEIRTPLNAIIGLNEMILKESAEDHVKGYSTDIKGASKTLLGLINDILDFSRIESGKVDLTPVKYWTAFLLTDSYNLIAKKAEEKHIELKVEADPMTPEQLYGDETRIRQIITNLLTNAVKYTNEGSITLKLHWRKNSIETALIRISVADTGVGISEEDQEKLFHSFQRVDEKRNRNIEGTGLGLVISKQLVELMGGRIWVKSVYGEGSEFFVEFPQMIVSERGMGEFSPRATISEDVMTSQAISFTAPEAKILVVDDVETNLKVMKNLLKDTLIRVETASSGQECLDLTDTNAYDVIFLDHRMPEMDGIETLHNMRSRSDDINQETPVIMLTANVVAGAKENYLKEGFTDYLTKPIRQSDLKQMLLDYLPLHKVVKEEHFAGNLL